MKGGSGLRLAALVIAAAIIIATAVTVVFGGGDDEPPPEVTITWLAKPTEHATPDPTGEESATAHLTTEPVETPTPDGPTGFVYPIFGGCLPLSDDLMPGAAREYRAGVHEGVDFYDADNCVAVGAGTPVVAAKAGTVVRADLSYQDLTAQSLTYFTNLALQSGGTDPDALDAFRGRQVWIEHDDGTVTRYCHLSAIAGGIGVGDTVTAGELLAFVGESGTPESVTAPGTEFHLHFEVRIGDTYLGAGLSPEEVRRLYEQVFSP